MSNMQRRTKDGRSRRCGFERLETRDLLSASKILFQTSASIGESEWRLPDLVKTIDTSSGSWNETYNATYPAAASGGSYVNSIGLVNPFLAQSYAELFLNWPVPPSRVDFGWPRVNHSHSILPLVAVPANTPYTVQVSWAVWMNNTSLNPEHFWSEPEDAVNYWSGTGINYRGNTYTVSGRTGGNPVVIDGTTYYRIEGYGNNGNISQNGSVDNPKHYTGFMVNDVDVQVRIDEGVPPEVELNLPADVSRGEVAHLDSLAWDPDNGPQSDGNGITWYKWEVTSPSGNETVRVGAEYEAIDLAFAETGEYQVKLTVYDDEGMMSLAEGTYSVMGVPPQVEIEGPSEVVIGNQARLVGTAFDPDNPSGELGIVSYHWMAPEGVVVENPDQPTTLITFLKPGAHQITLQVTDDEGDIAVAEHTVTVEAFNIRFDSINDVDPNNPTVFVTVEGEPNSLTWNLGNGLRGGTLSKVVGTSNKYQFVVNSVGTLPVARTHTLRVTASTASYTQSEDASVTLSGVRRLIHRHSLALIVPPGAGVSSGPIRTSLKTLYTDIAWSIPGQTYDRVIRKFELAVVTKIPKNNPPFVVSTVFGSVSFVAGTNSDGSVSPLTESVPILPLADYYSATIASKEFIVFSKSGSTVLELEVGGWTTTAAGKFVWIGQHTVQIRI